MKIAYRHNRLCHAASLCVLSLTPQLYGNPPEVAPPPVEKVEKTQGGDKVADPERNWLSKLADGSIQAQRKRQPILVRFGSQSCPWCRKLEVELRDATLAKELDRWTLVALDVAEAERDTRALAVGPIPALRLLTPDGRVVASLDGYVRAGELTEWLRKHYEAANIIPAEELTAANPPDEAAIPRLIDSLNQRDPTIREAAIRRLIPHPALAAKPVVDNFIKGSLQSRLAALELLRDWQAPVKDLDPWRPETITTASLDSLKKWAAAPPARNADEVRTLTAEEKKAVKEDLTRMILSTDAEAAAVRERLARFGPALLGEVYIALKEVQSDTARERLTALRYRLVTSDALALQWQGGIDRLASSKPAVRHEAIQELAQRATATDEPLLLELFGNPDAFMRELSLRTLHTVVGRTAAGPLARLLQDPDPNVRAAVLKQLAETPSQGVVPKIAEYLARETDLDLIVHAVRVLRAARGEAAVAQLKPLLKHTSWRVRAEAVEAMGECASGSESGRSSTVKSEVQAAVREALADSDGFVISRAVGILKKTTTTADVEALVQAATAHPELASEVVAALSYNSQLRDKTLPHLRNFCHHNDPAVRARAIAAVGYSAPDSVTDELQTGLKDTAAIVREAAARAIFDILNSKRSHAARRSINNSNDEKVNPLEEIEKLTAEIRAGKNLPQGMIELVPLLESQLHAKDPAERMEAALALIALDRGKGALPVLIAIVQANPSQVARGCSILPWLPWKERHDMFLRFLELGPSGDELQSLVRSFVVVPDQRGIVPLWEMAGRSGVSPLVAGEISSGLLELSGAEQYIRPVRSTPTLHKLAETAKGMAWTGTETQRLTALITLANMDSAAAAESSASLLEDAKISPSLRRDAFQVMLLSQPPKDATSAAVKALNEADPGIRRIAVQFLSVGSGHLRQLRDNLIYLNSLDPDSVTHFGQNDLEQYQPNVPQGLSRERLIELLRDSDPITRAGAGYLLALLGDGSGMAALIRYWREFGREDSRWTWLVVMAISCLKEDSSISVVEEVYRELKSKGAKDYRYREIRDVYWIIRPMSGPKALQLRKTIRAEIATDILGLDR